MKKIFVFSLVIIIAAMSVIAVSAAPRGGYYDQIGNKYWCNSDSYGCWVTGEDGGHEYIMFWSEAAAAAIMGPNSGAPVGTLPGTSTLNLAAPVAEAAAAKKSDEGGEKKGCTNDTECGANEECKDGNCVAKQTSTCSKSADSCKAEPGNSAKTCTVDGTDANCTCNCWCEDAKTDEQCRQDNGNDYHWEDSTCSCVAD